MAEETVAAVATPSGMGGVAIVRVSGTGVPAIARRVAGRLPEPRVATFCRFRDGNGEVIDEGIALYFRAPASFTGEDVLELQGHGGPVVADLLLRRVVACGARIAEPGEFSRRAFLNGKLDLVQAEAVADLIESGTAAAARLAVRSLEGEFSRRVHALVERVTTLRMYVEASIDFPEEEVDFLGDEKVSTDLQAITGELAGILQSARVGRLMRDGITLVIAGEPNAGKSSLMNSLAGTEAAIVTAIPGTTRDLLRERIQLDGIPVHLVDTAGLRESDDPVEREGIRRARRELERADHVLWVYDAAAGEPAHPAWVPHGVPFTLVRNKIDLTGTPAGLSRRGDDVEIAVSATQGDGIERLRRHLRSSAGATADGGGEFMARRRHLDALERSAAHLADGRRALESGRAGELLAEDLRQAQRALSEITGEVTADDLLGRIFSSFCIGK